MPIVPSGNRIKSIATGSPYSPSASFNPDKKQFFDTHGTTLGVLSGGPVLTDGTNVTVPTGFKFIHNGVVIELTAPFVVAIPVMGFPKYLMASNDSEVPGSNVTIDFSAVATPPNVLLATLNPDNFTVVQAKQLSIRALRQGLDMVTPLSVEQGGAPVKSGVGELNFVGPNIAVTDAGGAQANVDVTLDVKDETVLTSSKTKEIDFQGAGVTVTSPAANTARVTIPAVATQEEGVTAVAVTNKLNFVGDPVTAAVDGGDPNKANVTILAGTGVSMDGIVSGMVEGDAGVRQLQVTSLVLLRNGVLSSSITSLVTVTNNISGSPRTDLLQWDGTSLTLKAGTPGATAPCPTPDVNNIPVAVVYVPTGASALVRSMNKQSSTLDPVIIAYYYANGGLHASRVGATSDPSTTSATYIDANEMFLPVYFPRTGYRYELAWDAQVKQALYGFLNEGFSITMMFDGADEDTSVVDRGYLHNDLVGSVSIHGFVLSQGLCYNRLVNAGSHYIKGRWKVGNISAAQTLNQKRRRIWIHEIA